MNLPANHSSLAWLQQALARQVRRHPYLVASVAVHGLALTLLASWGLGEAEQVRRTREAVEVASSLRATQVASSVKRLQELQTIQALLEKSAAAEDPASGPASTRKPRGEGRPGPHPAGASTAALSASAPELSPSPIPDNPREMVRMARDLSRSIHATDRMIELHELGSLIGRPLPPASSAADADRAAMSGESAAPVTPEAAAREIEALEASARGVLARRQQRLQAKVDGVQIQGPTTGAGRIGGGDDAQQLAEIADIIGHDAEVGQSRSWLGYGGGDIFNHGKASIPVVDSRHIVPGRGRMIGPGGAFANRIYLNSWYLIGPFAGRHGAGLFDNPSYPPEKAVLLDAVYYGKDKRLLRWRYVTQQSYPLVPPDITEDSVYYGYTELRVAQDCQMTAWIGADDDVQLYLNDHLVWKGGNVNKQSYFDAIFNESSSYLQDLNRTEGTRVLHFRKGRNTLFFKLSNGPNSAFLSLILTP